MPEDVWTMRDDLPSEIYSRKQSPGVTKQQIIQDGSCYPAQLRVTSHNGDSWFKGGPEPSPGNQPTMEGWLYKQGSDVLNLWKRRWFVLSDYCLYYYKNPGDERVLGSLALPSFKITIVGPEDRGVFRKFSFKAEHSNTRTYYFAADSKELMIQWMNALSLASIMHQHASAEAVSRREGVSNHFGNSVEKGLDTARSNSGHREQLNNHHPPNQYHSQQAHFTQIQPQQSKQSQHFQYQPRNSHPQNSQTQNSQHQSQNFQHSQPPQHFLQQQQPHHSQHQQHHPQHFQQQSQHPQHQPQNSQHHQPHQPQHTQHPPQHTQHPPQPPQHPPQPPQHPPQPPQHPPQPPQHPPQPPQHPPQPPQHPPQPPQHPPQPPQHPPQPPQHPPQPPQSRFPLTPNDIHLKKKLNNRNNTSYDFSTPSNTDFSTSVLSKSSLQSVDDVRRPLDSNAYINDSKLLKTASQFQEETNSFYLDESGDFGQGVESNWCNPLQPVYANAPPKPRRLNSAEASINSESSPVPSKHNHSSFHEDENVIPNSFSDPKSAGNRLLPHSFSDYEQIYDRDNVQDQVSSSIGHPSYHNDLSRLRDSCASDKSNSTHISEEIAALELNSHSITTAKPNFKRVNQVRAHSADFLDYDRRSPAMALDNFSIHPSNHDPIGSGRGALKKHPTRSQSSMAQQIDTDYWSEENYAQKMRQSSLYHSKNMGKGSNRRKLSLQDASVTHGMSRSGPGADNNPNNLPSSVSNHSHNIHQNFTPDRLDNARLSVPNSSDDHNLQPDSQYHNHGMSDTRPHDQTDETIKPRNELAEVSFDSSMADNSNPGHGMDNKKVHQREESMKRLLEWKQRMLQSPLTKKTTSRSGASSPAVNNFKNNRMRSKTPDGLLSSHALEFQSKITIDSLRHAHGSVTPTPYLMHNSQLQTTPNTSDDIFSKSGSQQPPGGLHHHHHHYHVMHQNHPVIHTSDEVKHNRRTSKDLQPVRPNPQGAPTQPSSSRNRIENGVDSPRHRVSEGNAKDSRSRRSDRRSKDYSQVVNTENGNHQTHSSGDSGNTSRNHLDGRDHPRSEEDRNNSSRDHRGRENGLDHSRLDDDDRNHSRRHRSENGRDHSRGHRNENGKDHSRSRHGDESRDRSRTRRSQDGRDHSRSRRSEDSARDSSTKRRDKDTRRSASSIRLASNYSSDETDTRVEDRVVRKRTRRNSKRSASSETSDSLAPKQDRFSPKSDKQSVQSRVKTKNCTPSPDYVNITSMEIEKQPFSVITQQPSPSNQRAEPIFIDFQSSDLNTSNDHNNSIDRELQALDDPQYLNLTNSAVDKRSEHQFDDAPNEVLGDRYLPPLVPNADVGRHGDDQSTGKYPDSGYDTLKYDNGAEKIVDSHILHSYNSVKEHSNEPKSKSRRPETWSPDKFAHENIQYHNVLDKHILRKEKSEATIVGLCLESPKIVKETQQATQRNLVRDRIKAFSEKLDPSSDQVNNISSRRKSLDPKMFQSMEFENGNNLKSEIVTITTPNPEFMVSKTTMIKANEAQVKSLHDYGKRPDYDVSGLRMESMNPREIFGKEKSNSVNNMKLKFEFTDSNHYPEYSSESAGKNAIDDKISADAKDNESVIPPRPPKKPNLGGEMNRRHTSNSVVSFMEDEDQYMDSRGFDSQAVSDQLYVNNPNFYNSVDQNIRSGGSLGEPPSENAPMLPAISKKVNLAPHVEENYLPMSPPKMLMSHKKAKSMSVIHGRSSLSQLDELAEFEEHTYIEMNGDKNKKVQRPILALPINTNIVSQSLESPCYYEIGEKDEGNQHYEYIYRAASHYESIYQEVPGTAPHSPPKDEKPIVPKKPSDLKMKSNSTKSLIVNDIDNTFSHKSLSSSNYEISSDADDESSKDLESLQIPKNKRFSLSDTFRPASYYLSGAEPSSDPDAQDSSDSDLVSPPPIPTSPPPLDELDTNPHSNHFSYDNLATPEPPAHLRNALSTSRSMRSGKYKSSKENSVTNLSSTMEGKKAYSSSALFNDKLKGPPVFNHSQESLQNDESFILGSEDHYPISSAYPDFNNMAPIQRDRTSSRSSHDIMLTREKTALPSLRSRSSLDHNSSFHDSLLNKNVPFQNDGSSNFRYLSCNDNDTPASFSANSSTLNLDSRSLESSRNGGNKDSSSGFIESSGFYPSNSSLEAVYQNYPAYNSYSGSNSQINHLNDQFLPVDENIRSPVHQRTLSDLSTGSLNTPSKLSATDPETSFYLKEDALEYFSSETSPRSAPYYYSDVIRDSNSGKAKELTSLRSRNQLNNQRDLEPNKRYDIGRKVNLLSPTNVFDQNKIANKVQEKTLFTNNNYGESDQRNSFNADTLRKLKERTLTPSFEVDSRKSQNSFYKSESLSSLTNHRRTRSLEGLMEEPCQAGQNDDENSVQMDTYNLFNGSSEMNTSTKNIHSENSLSGNEVPSHNFGRELRSVSNTPSKANYSNNSMVFDTTSNDWENDSQWVDQLRRASIRHTRSLETLDESNVNNLSDTHNSKVLKPNPDGDRESYKINKDLNEYRVDYREGLINPFSLNKNAGSSETLERTNRGLTCLEGYEWDPAEERFTRPLYLQSNDIESQHNQSSNSFLSNRLLTPPKGNQETPVASEEQNLQEGPTCTPTLSSSQTDPNSRCRAAGDGFNSSTNGGVRRRQAEVPTDDSATKTSGDGNTKDNEDIDLSDENSNGCVEALTEALELCDIEETADVSKLNQRNQYGNAPQTFNGDNKYGQTFGQTYQPLQAQPFESHHARMGSNQSYPGDQFDGRNYQGYNKGSLGDVNQGAFTSGTQPPNYQQTIKNLYQRQQELEGQARGKYPVTVDQLYGRAADAFGGYSEENSPVHQYQGAQNLDDYPGYDPEYQTSGYDTYTGGHHPVDHMGAKEFSDPELSLIKLLYGHFDVKTLPHKQQLGEALPTNHKLYGDTSNHYHKPYKLFHTTHNHIMNTFRNTRTNHYGDTDRLLDQEVYDHFDQDDPSKKYPKYISYSNPTYMMYYDRQNNDSGLGLDDMYQTPTYYNNQYTNTYQYPSNLSYKDTPYSKLLNHPHQHHPQQQHHLRTRQLMMKEEEEFKAEERRRKIISEVVRDGTETAGLSGVSAGELLNKTHEELVLLLIQLRREHATLQEARKQARRDRDEQARLANLDKDNRAEYLEQSAECNNHLMELDKQYEMGKPLINLVDNMVKLGTLYRGLETNESPSSPSSGQQQNQNCESLEFSRRVLERRLVDEDREEYDMLSPNQGDLESKVLRLYNLEHSLRKESLAIQNFQTQKEVLERALKELLTGSGPETSEELQRRYEQRLHLQMELSKLRGHLADSAGKLEDTAAENSRLEHEMMMLRQKIQQTMARNASRDTRDGSANSRHIESEMMRVQALLEDLQGRRMMLSHQIQRMTLGDKDQLSRYGTMHSISPTVTYVSISPTDSTTNLNNSTWLETDLDLNITRDMGVDLSESPIDPISPDLYSRDMDYSMESPYMGGGGDYSPLEVVRSSLFAPQYSTAYSSPYRRHTLDPLYAQKILTRNSTAAANYEKYSASLKELASTSGTGVPSHHLGALDRSSFLAKPVATELSHDSHLRLDNSEDADERMKRFYGLLPKEKPLEPKTVRIVKRESTERRKDKCYTSSSKKGSLSHLMEDELESDSGDPTSGPELDSEPSPSHVTSLSSGLKSTQSSTLSSSYSSGYSSASHLQQSSTSTSLYQPSTSFSSVNSVTSVEATVTSSALPSYSQRTASLPRNYGKPSAVGGGSEEWGEKPKRRTKNTPSEATPSSRPNDLPIRQKQQWKSKTTERKHSVSAREQLFGAQQAIPLDSRDSDSPSRSSSSSPPTFKSAAAHQIIREMSSESEKYRRAVPKEKKRKHVTISSSRPLSMEGSHRRDHQAARSRDDCDMARVLRPRNHPDVVKSTLSTRDLRITETTIDSIFGAPSKIHIPERYVPDEDDVQQDTAEERLRRQHKADSIRRMLTDSTSNLTAEGVGEEEGATASAKDSQDTVSKVKERQEREHLLAMNQILARQVMEKSRLVAARANKNARLDSSSSSEEDFPPEGFGAFNQQREKV